MAVNPYVGIQVIVAADFSGSMTNPISQGSSISRINALREKIHYVFSEVCKYDPDGIDVITFNNKVKLYRNVSTPDKVNDIFNKSPGGGTDTTGAFNQAFGLHKEYMKKPNFESDCSVSVYRWRTLKSSRS